MPGDATCRPVAACGDAPWGDIPTSTPNTQHVDAGYTALDADGTAEKPWPTVQAGIDAAEPSAIVAVAAGSYGEAVVVSKPITLWGRCPELVVLSSGGVATITIGPEGDGATIRGLQLQPDDRGVLIDGADGVELRELWIREAGMEGIRIHDGGHEIGGTFRRLLMDQVGEMAMLILGSTAVDAEEVCAEQLQVSADHSSTAIRVEQTDGRRGRLSLRRSTLRGCYDRAIDIDGAEATVEQVALLSADACLPDEQKAFRVSKDEGQEGQLQIRSSFIDGERRYGIQVANGRATVEQTVVRASRLYCDGELGEIGALTLRQSVIEGVVGTYGVHAYGCDVSIEASIVRDQVLAPDQSDNGFGVVYASQVLPAQPELPAGRLVVQNSLISRTYGSGILHFNGAAELLHSRIELTRPLPDSPAGENVFGDGVTVVSVGGSSLTVRASDIVDNRRAGIASFGAVVTVGDTDLRCNTLGLSGESWMGDSFFFDDLGGNRCGCSEEDACQVVSVGLAPPTPPLPE